MKWRYMLFGALLAAAVLLLGAQMISVGAKQAVGTFQAVATEHRGVLILDTTTGALYDEKGATVGGVNLLVIEGSTEQEK